MDIRKFFSDLLLTTLSSLVVVCLFFVANTSVFALITSDVNKVKDIFANSGVYDTAAPVILDQVIAQQEGTEAALLLKDPQVQKLARQSLDADFLRSATESFLDGTYAWLNGESSEPEFRVDLRSAKKDFVANTSDYAIDRLAGLPPCRFDQLPRDINILSTNCAPPGITRAVVQTELEKQLAGSEGLLPEKTLTPDNLENSDGQPVFQQLEGAPQIFKWANILPWAIGIIGLIAAVGVVLLSASRASGLKRLGITLIVGAVILSFVPSITDYVLGQALDETTGQNKVAKNIVLPLVQEFNQRAATIYFVFAATALVVGIALLAVRKKILN